MNPSSLTNRAYLEHLLHEAGLRPRHDSGQHFLICPDPIEAVVGALDAHAPAITELGAGLGPLTHALLAAHFKVRAIEWDRGLAALHQQLLPAGVKDRHQLIGEDLRTANWTWDEPYQVVGNIPYNMSGLIVRRLTTTVPAPVRVVLMVQREVAQRLAAAPPQMNLIGLAAQAWARVELLEEVPPSCFWPEPQVVSQLVVLHPYPATKHSESEREALLSFARPFFQTKRKQIGKRLRTLIGEAAEAVLKESGLTALQRPQELRVEDWRKLREKVREKMVY
jgi:16S rRNA (adenine1518-N6/adenine1519-N6)-dimethyltransferase